MSNEVWSAIIFIGIPGLLLWIVLRLCLARQRTLARRNIARMHANVKKMEMERYMRAPSQPFIHKP
jgi:hypothetical protein